jgi:(S)-mandelate dehydrogenase
MSTVSMSLIEDIAREAPGRLWLQAYVFSERRITEAIIGRARDAGFECVMLTSDFPVAGKRERDMRTGLLPHQQFTLATRLDMLMHPRWLATVATRRPRFVNVERELGPGRDVNSFVGHGMFDPSFRWDDIRRFRDLWPRKLLLKGVLRADDAERAVAAGIDGIVLSNHGGRQLDGAISGIEALPEVVRAVGGRVSILVDGGVRRGSDIAKAIALGAEGVILGRAPVYGLAAGGAPGVARAIAILADEFDRTLALTGCRNVAALTADLIAAGAG